jgi:hypothetical protein
MTQNIREKFEKKIYEALCLEVDPDGRDGMYLIRNEKGKVEYGIDFDQERREILAAFDEALREELEAIVERIRKSKVQHVDNPNHIKDEIYCCLECYDQHEKFAAKEEDIAIIQDRITRISEKV